MKPTSVRKKLLFNGAFLVILTGALTPALNVAADPVSDLRSLSVLKDVDLSKLSGDNVSAAGAPISRLARGMSVQSAYVVRAPIKTTLSLLQQWNPTRHPELRTYLQGDLPSKPGPDSFRSLASAPSNASVRAFVEATEQLPGDSSKLQLSTAEAKQYSGGAAGGGGSVSGPVLAFWSQVLAERARSFASGGLGSESSYQTGVSPATEVAQLLDSSGDVRSHFSPIISATPLGGGGGSSPSLSWQLFDANGQAAVSLDAFYAKPVGDGYQTLDLGFYSSSGYYAVVTLEQLWPVQVEGRDATLIWRVDLVSSGTIGELRGTERLGSGAAMMRDIQKTVRAFVKDASGSR
ncbi:MAG: hypothetical protein JOZ08_09460 [Verrucomicrobia bacterium]|nr:hypothetical protein [Verrucomicrobiota bacterium]